MHGIWPASTASGGPGLGARLTGETVTAGPGECRSPRGVGVAVAQSPLLSRGATLICPQSGGWGRLPPRVVVREGRPAQCGGAGPGGGRAGEGEPEPAGAWALFL